MSLIDFQAAGWAGVVGIELPCDTGGQNTLEDTGNGASFIIESGKMEVVQYPSGARNLLFSQITCDDDVGDQARLVIRFDEPQEFVELRVEFKMAEHMLFEFYEEHGQTNMLDNRQVPWAFLTIHEVLYDEPGAPIKEVRIRCADPENILHSVEFHETSPPEARDIAMALDGSGSMAAQGKWGAMIEAASIFHHLYRAIGQPDDTLGAVLFRWSCFDQLGGDQTVPMPELTALDEPLDLPSLYEPEGPGGCTPIGEAVVEAAEMAAAGGNPSNHLVLLTDGKNNRGRSVEEASGDPALANQTVHVIGLGTEQFIDPVEIAALASAHGGSFRQTIEPSEILDFFAQALGETVGKVEMALVSDDNRVTLAAGTTRAVFLIAWADPSESHDFDLVAPDGTEVDHANPPSIPGIEIEYHPAPAGVAHAYFVVEGEIAGEWELASLPDGAEPLAVEDLALRVEWSVTPVLGLTGEPITITARVTYEGEPYTGDVQFRARVKRPSESRGDLIARQVQEKPLPPFTRPTRDQDVIDVSLRDQAIGEILDRLGREDFRFESAPAMQFQNVSEGVYRLQVHETDYDGVYRFDLEAEGTETPFARRTTRCVTLVTKPDPDASEVRTEPAGDGLYRVSVVPVAANGTLVGPFLERRLTPRVSSGETIGRLSDNLDGSYTQIVRSDGPRPPEVSFSLLDRPVTHPSPPAGEPRGWGGFGGVGWLVALILLVVVLILVFG